MSEPLNKTASSVNKVISAAVNLGMDAAKAALIVEAPWLKTPVLNWMTNFLFDFIGNKIYVYFAEHSTFIVVDLQSMQKKKDYLDALERLRKSQEFGDRDAIEKEKEALRKRLADLIRWPGTASP